MVTSFDSFKKCIDKHAKNIDFPVNLCAILDTDQVSKFCNCVYTIIVLDITNGKYMQKKRKYFNF